jgi:hypothetical protein
VGKDHQVVELSARISHLVSSNASIEAEARNIAIVTSWSAITSRRAS